MSVEASLLIEFGDDEAESATVTVEFDDTHPNNLNSEGELKNSFLPEDTPVFLIHHDSTVEITAVRCTDGSVTNIGNNILRTRSIDALFTTLETENSIGYSGVNSALAVWYGHTGALYVDGANLKISTGVIPCYCTATFGVNFNKQYQLNPPVLDLTEDETYVIYVVIYIRSVS